MDIEQIKRSVKGSLAVEGIKPSKKGEQITDLFLNGQITSFEAIKKIKNLYLGGNKNEKFR